jgi:hypothetical protein
MLLNRFKFSIAVHAILGAALLPACSAAAQSVMIKPKFSPGSTTYHVAQQEVVQKVSGGQFGEAGAEFKSSETYGVLQKVEPAPEGKGHRIIMTFDRIAQAMQNMMMNLSFDSDLNDPADRSDPLAIIYGPALGMSITMDLDAENNITSFSGMDAIWEKVQKSAVGNPMLQQMRTGFSDEGARVKWGDSRLALYPNKEVKAGDTWHSEVRSPSPAGDFITERHMKLERIGKEDGREVAVVSYTTSTRRAPEAKNQPVMGGMMLDIVSSEGTGRATYDIAKGVFVRDQSDAKMVIELRHPSADSEDSDTGSQSDQNKEQNDATEAEGTPAAAAKDAEPEGGAKSKPSSTPPAMTIEVNVKETYTVMTAEQRNQEREENRLKAKDAQEAEDTEDDPGDD